MGEVFLVRQTLWRCVGYSHASMVIWGQRGQKQVFPQRDGSILYATLTGRTMEGRSLHIGFRVNDPDRKGTTLSGQIRHCRLLTGRTLIYPTRGKTLSTEIHFIMKCQMVRKTVSAALVSVRQNTPKRVSRSVYGRNQLGVVPRHIAANPYGPCCSGPIKHKHRPPITMD